MNLFTYNKIRNNPTGGFTLVEVLVSLSIFTFVATAAVGTLLVMIDANRKSQNIQSAMSNLSFALDSMTRDIRTGTQYYCHTNDSQLPTSVSRKLDTRNCVAGAAGNSFAFNEGGSSLTSGCSGGVKRIAFRLDSGVIERRICSGPSWDPITAPEVQIDTFNIVTTGVKPVFGSGTNDTESPTVTLHIAGTASGKAKTQATFEIQTTITQQLLDI